MKKRKIVVYGVGAVGKAISDGLKFVGHDIIEYDKRLDTEFSTCLKSDIIFICLPTPSNLDGSINLSIVEEEIEKISNHGYEGLICLKSTIKPGTTDQFIAKFPNLKFCFVPEFLRERAALEDFTQNHDLLLIGTHEIEFAELVIEIHGDLPKQIKVINPLEAELVKYFSNVYNALRITFANNFFEICNKLNANYDEVLKTYLMRGLSTGNYLSCSDQLRGYGGMCLPKDTKALISLMNELNLDLDLIKSIESDNSKYKVTVFNGMRE